MYSKKYIKLIIVLIALTLFTQLLFGALIELKNDYIKIIGDPDTGRFIFKTTGGDPDLNTDQDSLLLYEDYPPTSFTTLKIDGVNYKFGDNEKGRFTTTMISRNNRVMCVWRVGNIEVMEELRFMKGPTTGRDDTVEIAYTIINKDSRKHKIGVRIMLDTYLGKEDGAPFRVPGLGDIKTEKDLSGNKIPQYWYSYDDLGEPSVRAQGTLKAKGITPPDRIIFSSWERFQKYLWDFTIKPGRSFRRSIIGPLDSALAMFWNPKEVEPNNTLKIITYYGLYGASIYKGKVFNISLGGPVTTTGEPFLVTADIQNVSPKDAKNTMAEIILPQGLKLVVGENSKKNLATLRKSEIKKVAWNIIPDKTATGFITFKVKVTGKIENKLETAIAERKIEYKGKKVEVSLYDFSGLNKLLERINSNLDDNNTLLENINDALQSDTKEYNDTDKETDRAEIKNRETEAKKIKDEIDNAAKSAYKKK